MNRIRLHAVLIERSALRFTPAGMPVLEAVLDHDGTVIEAGGERKVRFEAAAVAIGAIAERLNREPLGTSIDVDGFLAVRSYKAGRRGQLRIHLTDYRTSRPSKFQE